jgi:hypothetical protein
MKRSTSHKKTRGVLYPAPAWTDAELRVLDRHVQLVLAGKLASPRHATTSCLPDLERIRESTRSGHTRTWEATYRALLGRIPARFRSRYRRPPSWTPAEMRIMNRYAQAVAEGKYKNAADAAAACVTPLAELRRRQAGPRPCAPVRRSEASIYGQIRARARALGVRAAWSHSSPAERKIVFEWVERYWRTRDVSPTWYVTDLADLMRTELQHKGFHRDKGFCERTLARRIRLSRRQRASRA